jgi:superfamily II DNA helicase RecQ
MTHGVLEDAVSRFWGYTTFRPLQREAMDAVLSGRDSIVVLPTGGGKSLCFQAPAVVRPGLALVVSPLISLMKDQVDTLVGNGVPAALYNSSLSSAEKADVVAGLRQQRYRLLYVSPERLVGDGGESFFSMISSCGVSFVAVDEAHCISQWGHDFRPEYRQLGRLRELLPGVSLHAYTATATARVRRDIAAQLQLKDPLELVGSFDRPNLLYRALPRATLKKQLIDILGRHRGEAGIVYCTSRREVEALAAWLTGIGVTALPYHAGLSDLGAQPPPGRVPERARGRDCGHGGVRHGHRSIRRALRRSRGSAAVARALPAGVRPCGARWPGGRVPADLLAGGFHEVADDAGAERRADGGRRRAAAADGALRGERGMPPPPPVGIFRR